MRLHPSEVRRRMDIAERADLTSGEKAARFGLTPFGMRSWCRKMGIRLVVAKVDGGALKRKLSEDEIVEHRKTKTLREIAADAGVSYQRIKQICDKYWPEHSVMAREVRRRARIEKDVAKIITVAGKRLRDTPPAPCAVCGRLTQRKPQQNYLCTKSCGQVARTTDWRWGQLPGYKAVHSARVRRYVERMKNDAGEKGKRYRANVKAAAARWKEKKKLRADKLLSAESSGDGPGRTEEKL